VKIKYKIYTLILAELIVFQACCSKEDLVDISNQQVIFLDKNTNENLFNNPTYNKDSLAISYNNGISFERIQSSFDDSVINIDFKMKDTCYLKITNTDIDTFFVNYQNTSDNSEKGQCKLNARVLKDIRFNNNTLQNASYTEPVIIYK
jgi:hypothetical protein